MFAPWIACVEDRMPLNSEERASRAPGRQVPDLAGIPGRTAVSVDFMTENMDFKSEITLAQ
jgi:hypothetical protein